MGTIERLPKRPDPARVPVAGEEPGLITVDATWGTIQPLTLPGGVQTVAELEVIALIGAGATLIDTRQPEYVAKGTLPTATPIRHQEIVERLAGMQLTEPVVLFCNGPQCGATPHAIAELLEAGWNPERLRYYRGGIHDWVTLGLPLVTPA
jgi:rhodanese-related sulfurtransferase